MPTHSTTTDIAITITAFVAGCVLSPLLARLILFLATDRSLKLPVGCDQCERRWSWIASLRSRPCDCGARSGWWPLILTLWTGTLLATFTWLYFHTHCQAVTEVRPSTFWFYGRYFAHSFLFLLLTIAIGTDLRNYTIADILVLTGAIIGVLLATLSGYLQTIHIWVDWNDLYVELHGPYLPEWMKNHPHLHGFAWSMTGLIAGAGITWIVRVVAQTLLQKPALGLGDVTLMAMVGSYTGWQPVTLILLLAPILAIVIGMLVWLTTRRTFLAYGPYLALATMIIMSSWKWIWNTDLKLVFGDVKSLLILTGVAGGALVVMLIMLTLYGAIPVQAGGSVGQAVPDESD